MIEQEGDHAMISLSAGAAGKTLANVQLASGRDKQTDAICAGQDNVGETLSQGVEQGRSALDRLVASKGPLDRFLDDKDRA
jgi:hypothetical protein